MFATFEFGRKVMASDADKVEHTAVWTASKHIYQRCPSSLYNMNSSQCRILINIWIEEYSKREKSLLMCLNTWLKHMTLSQSVFRHFTCCVSDILFFLWIMFRMCFFSRVSYDSHVDLFTCSALFWDVIFFTLLIYLHIKCKWSGLFFFFFSSFSDALFSHESFFFPHVNVSHVL